MLLILTVFSTVFGVFGFNIESRRSCVPPHALILYVSSRPVLSRENGLYERKRTEQKICPWWTNSLFLVLKSGNINFCRKKSQNYLCTNVPNLAFKLIIFLKKKIEIKI
jgi:hypothetical protein